MTGTSVTVNPAGESNADKGIPASLWGNPELAEPLARRDIARIFQALQAVGISQRTIARLTGQSQSEVSEILAGRRVRMIDVLERIADGLKIPRARMGLAEGVGAPSHPVPRRPQSWPPAVVRQHLPAAPQVFHWTGAEVRMLRQAMRMSIREFAAHLGVSDRMVSKWEAAGENITPRPMNQAALDTCLTRASADVHARFAEWPTRTRNHAGLIEARRWVMHVVLDVSTLDTAVTVAQRVLASVHGVPKLMAKETTVSPEDRPFHRYQVHM